MSNSRVHVLAIAFPAQGHVGPLMKLSQQIADHGIKVTFVNTEFVHAQILAALPEKSDEQNCAIDFISIPDGLEPGDDRKDRTKLRESMLRVMPGHFENLIREINSSDGNEKITCVIADATFGWALETAEKMEIKRAMFWPSAAGSFALGLHIPKLIEDGIIDNDGIPMRYETIQLTQTMPVLSTEEILWKYPGDPDRQKHMFSYVFPTHKNARISNWLLCSSFSELDPSALDLIPNLLPVGPILSSNCFAPHAGNFWPEELTCLGWLDQQPLRSVIYVAFGSIAILSQHQFEELALGLELVGHSFLWVVRSDLIKDSTIKYPDHFLERVADRGKIVEWAPQEKVLAHPSVACFLTHCGWNSTMEGLSMGVPFLCWPKLGDQFHNKKYICDVWKVGLELHLEENGIICRHEIVRKIETLLCDKGIGENVLKLKEMARNSISEGGSSVKNFKSFLEQMKC